MPIRARQHRSSIIPPIAAALVCLALNGCGGDAGQPPPEFGSKAWSWFGCPSMQGEYVWPPVAGAYAGGVIASNRKPWVGNLPIFINGKELQIWIEQNSSRLVIRVRDILHKPDGAKGMRHSWGYKEYHITELRCVGSMREFAEVDLGKVEDFGGDGIRRGFRLARMKDGALAVGIKTVAYGGKGQLIPFSDASAGEYQLSDRSFWRWSKLAQSGPGDKEPDAINHSQGH